MIGAAIVLALGLGGAADTPPGLEPVFEQGVKAYDALDYDQAAEAWEKLLRFRVSSHVVEYNLGNAYFKKKDYGRAVLHWERALKLRPGDSETRENLDLVRGLLIDEVKRDPTPVERAFEWAAALGSGDETFVVVLLAWHLLGLSLLLALLRPGVARRIGIAVAVAALVALALSAPLWLVQARARADKSRLVVLEPAVEVRSGPGDQYPTVFTIHEGLVTTARESAGSWQRVELPNGLDGWIPREAGERI